MKRSTDHRRVSVLTVATLGLVIASPSHAYLDPGTGSIILQGLLASVAVAIGLLRHYWLQFKSFLGKLAGKSRENNDDVEPEFDQASNTQSKS